MQTRHNQKSQKQTSETIVEQDDNDQMQIIDNSKIKDFLNDSDEEEVAIFQN